LDSFQDVPPLDHSAQMPQAAGIELARGRHFPLHRGGPGSDSGSSGNSSADSIDSSSSSNRPNGVGGGGLSQGSILQKVHFGRKHFRLYFILIFWTNFRPRNNSFKLSEYLHPTNNKFKYPSIVPNNLGFNVF
jgi:hypothetical protein